MVGIAGFEPAAFPSQAGRATKLRYIPIWSEKRVSNPLGSKTSDLQSDPAPYGTTLRNKRIIVVYSQRTYFLRGTSFDLLPAYTYKRTSYLDYYPLRN